MAGSLDHVEDDNKPQLLIYKGHFTLQLSLEMTKKRTKDSLGGELKFVYWAFTLETNGKG
jgi:hypothetical protein